MGHTFSLRHGRWRNTVVVDNRAITQVCFTAGSNLSSFSFRPVSCEQSRDLHLTGPNLTFFFLGGSFWEFRKQPPRLLPEMAGTRATVLSTKRDWGVAR